MSRQKLYVGNLSYNTTEEGLRVAFSEGGRQVVSVAIIMHPQTNRPRGFAFVEMGTDEDADAAISAWDGQELDGRTLKVNVAQQRPSRPPRRFGPGGPSDSRPSEGGFGGRSFSEGRGGDRNGRKRTRRDDFSSDGRGKNRF